MSVGRSREIEKSKNALVGELAQNDRLATAHRRCGNSHVPRLARSILKMNCQAPNDKLPRIGLV